MKYEYLKGNEGDFIGLSDAIKALYQLPTRSVSYSALSSSELPSPYCDHIIAERRPITEPVVNQQLTTEWGGEGLPPIGCVCEYRGNDTSWGEVKIIGHDEGKVVFKPSGEDYYGITPSHKAEFIPIHSSEGVARDEAIDGMAEIIEFRTGCSPRPLAKWLYDAGYRKME